MECKFTIKFFKGSKSIIKIYPEWNVNSLLSKVLLIVLAIKIYPEWNVNRNVESKLLFKLLLKSTQSGM